MKTIFLIIPHYVFTSDLLRTKYIEYLAKSYRVVVITPMIDGETARRRGYFQSSNLVYQKKPLEASRFWSVFKLLRLSLVNEFDYLSYFKQYYLRPNYRNNKKRRILRFFGKPFSSLLRADFFTKLETLFAPRARELEHLVNLYKPLFVISATPGLNPFEAEAIIMAKRRRLPTVAVNFTWDELTTTAKHIRKTDYLITWNRVIKKEAIGIHRYSPKKVFVAGTIRFDPYFTSADNELSRERFLASKKLNPKYKTIFHTTVTKAYPFQKKYIRDLIRLRKEGEIPYVNLFIRIHPRDIYENYREFANIPDLCIEKAGQQIDENNIEMDYDDLLNLKYSFRYSDININYASTISIEACIFNKPIINIGYLGIYAMAYDFDHYRPIYKSGAVSLAKNDKDLSRLINMYLDNPSLDSENRKKVVDDYVEFTDGLSYKRSVDLLERII